MRYLICAAPRNPDSSLGIQYYQGESSFGSTLTAYVAMAREFDNVTGLRKLIGLISLYPRFVWTLIESDEGS